ncbi:hypothetical protein [Saccharicrinis aurantiacus]|uniref:hypothetical protein n=1 Tax=Saccharicrinis aurantiacus TaxID=1849719 RepID=UPI00094F64C4|nr:hypothetical protein [Saccharicrinis aurantiacus]
MKILSKPFILNLSLIIGLLISSPLKADETCTIPKGTNISINVDRSIASKAVQPEFQFGGVIDLDVLSVDKILIPAGTKVMGKVISVKTAGRVAGQAEIVMVLTKIQKGDKYVAIQTEALSVKGEAQGKKTARNVGVGAATGAAFNKGTGAGRGAATMGAVSILSGDGNITIPKGYNLQFPISDSVNFE